MLAYFYPCIRDQIVCLFGFDAATATRGMHYPTIGVPAGDGRAISRLLTVPITVLRRKCG
jgi:hypothetical protein